MKSFRIRNAGVLIGKAGYPLFVICEGKGQDAIFVRQPEGEMNDERQQQQQGDGEDVAGTEDFVFL
jgi:hypothetical protein